MHLKYWTWPFDSSVCFSFYNISCCQYSIPINQYDHQWHALWVASQVQSIDNKMDLLLNFYSQCLKKGSSHFTLSSLLEPDLTSDYHSPTDQRELFPSATTLNIAHSDSGNMDWAEGHQGATAGKADCATTRWRIPHGFCNLQNKTEWECSPTPYLHTLLESTAAFRRIPCLPPDLKPSTSIYFQCYYSIPGSTHLLLHSFVHSFSLLS